MSKASKIGIAIVLTLLLFLMSPFILYKVVIGVWDVYCTIEQYVEDRAVAKASKSIEQFEVGDEKYDIMTVRFGVSNSEIEYERIDSRLEITSIEYKMGSSAFNNHCTHWLYSYQKEGNDVQLINDICKVLNQYDLGYTYVDGYGYRGFLYGNGYVFGQYDGSYLNGQYIEILLRPIEGPETTIRFDLELSPDSVEYQIVKDLRAIDKASDEDRLGSFYNLLGLINSEKQEKTD